MHHIFWCRAFYSFLDFVFIKNNAGLIWNNVSSNCRSKKYISLMEHLSEEELVMRSFIDGVELLVFTSKVLHEDSCSEFSSPS